MPPFPSLSPAYQFCTVEYLIVASFNATSSTTAACSCDVERFGAVQPSRYDTYEPSSATMSVRSNWPVPSALMRKYVDNSIGQRTPFGTYTNEPSENTAEFSAAKKLSLYGTTEPRYFRTSSGYSRTASPSDMKMMPSVASSAFIVVPTDTESKIASTATPASIFCSYSGMPSFAYVLSSSGS